MSLRRCLHQNFSKIKHDLLPMEITDFLYQEGVIDREHYEMIFEARTNGDRTEQLLWSLSYSRAMNEEETMRKIEEALRRQGSIHLLEHFTTASPDEEMVEALFPDNIVERTIDEKRDFLKEELEPLVCIDQLVDRGVLSIADHKSINEQYRIRKVEYLIEHILKNPARNFTIFCEEMIGECIIDQLKETANRIMQEPVPSQSIQQNIQVQEIDRRNMEESMEHDGIRIHFSGVAFDDVMMRYNVAQIDQERLRDEINQYGVTYRNLSYGSIILELQTRSPKAKENILVECKMSPQFLQRHLKKCLTDECMNKLRRMNVQKVDIEVSVAFPDSACCRSKLTKALVEKNVSYLEDHLKQVDVLAGTLNGAGFDYDFSTCLDEKSTPKEVNARFLEILIKDVSIGEDHFFCLLETALKATGQLDLLQTITHPEANITTEDIGKHQKLLLNEIEPKLFLKMLDTIPEGGTVRKQILSCETRRQRSQTFVDFVIKSGQDTVETFIAALEQKGLSYIVDAIKESENKMNRIYSEDKEEWRDSLLSFSEEIVGEVDPHQLCPVLIKMGLINKKENADLTSSDSINRTWLMKQARVLHNVRDFVECFQLAGYPQLAHDIRAEKERCGACPQHSPTGSKKSDVLKHSYTIIYHNSEASQEPNRTMMGLVLKEKPTAEDSREPLGTKMVLKENPTAEDSKQPQGTTIELVLMENHTDTTFAISVGEVTFQEKDQVLKALVNILSPGPWSDSEFCGLTERNYTAIKVKMKMLIGDLLEDDQTVVSAAASRDFINSFVIIKVRSETPASVQRLRKKWFSPEIDGIMCQLQTTLRKTFSESLTIKAVLAQESSTSAHRGIDKDKTKEKSPKTSAHRGMDADQSQDDKTTEKPMEDNEAVKPLRSIRVPRRRPLGLERLDRDTSPSMPERLDRDTSPSMPESFRHWPQPLNPYCRPIMPERLDRDTSDMEYPVLPQPLLEVNEPLFTLRYPSITMFSQDCEIVPCGDEAGSISEIRAQESPKTSAHRGIDADQFQGDKTKETQESPKTSAHRE